VGIAPAEQATIFEAFVRGSGARSLNVKGTGVGLAMVRHIVRAHGGEITLESAQGHGSTFTVRLSASGVDTPGAVT
jgi:two-component system sensor histidine kinase SenX3